MRKDPAAPHHSPAHGGSLQRGRPGDLMVPARGLLFDNDGVLVDSEVSVVESWSRWARDQGLDPAEVLAAVPGRRAADTVALFVTPDRLAGAVASITRHELEDVAGTTAVPGAVDLLTQLPADRWAVVTSGVRALATARLRAAGVPLPGHLVAAEDVTAGKPHPQPYLTGAARLGMAPADLVVLEDSPSGVAAGLAAGCRVLGIGELALGTRATAVARNLSGVRWTGEGLLVPAATLLRS